jgi:predicted dehydrogenase
MKRLRAAVVGVGYLGNFHAQKYKALSAQAELAVDLVAVCDQFEPQARKIGEALGTAFFTDPKELLGKVDLVTIATVTPAHYEIAKLFLENGVHVNVEKPIALKSEQARELVALAERKGLSLAVGHSERFGSIFQKFHSHIQHQEPRWIELSRYAPFNKRGSDVSVLHDLMIHDLDLMLSLDRTKPRLVSARAGKIITDTFDWCSAVFEFESGLHVNVNASRLSKEMIRQIRAATKNHLWLANLQTGDLEKTEVDKNEGRVSIAVEAVGRSDNLLLETESFIRHLQQGKPLLVTGRDGLNALELVEMILGSMDSDIQTKFGW